jgi:hypothetical protein
VSRAFACQLTAPNISWVWVSNLISWNNKEAAAPALTASTEPFVCLPYACVCIVACSLALDSPLGQYLPQRCGRHESLSNGLSRDQDRRQRPSAPLPYLVRSNQTESTRPPPPQTAFVDPGTLAPRHPRSIVPSPSAQLKRTRAALVRRPATFLVRPRSHSRLIIVC